MKRSLPGMMNSRSMMVAVMVGAALAAGEASARANENRDQAVQDINRYCTACWRNARLPTDAWSDCTQEVFCRLLQSVPLPAWGQVLTSEGEERQEFLRAIDAVKKRTQRRKKYSVLGDDASDRGLHPRLENAENRELIAHAAENVLSHRQKQIIRLSFDGYSVQDLAEKLHMSPQRVSDEKYKAIRKLRIHLGVDA